ncbi:MAG: excisionase family DNA-binding protein [Deltaproteobacteria bacterium]|nr:excisionase family DNA-binding protein [Deltaproteobacteria bacterium]
MVFTTGDVANLLHIHQTTVIDWIEKGHLTGYRTPGGHRRIQRDELVRFLHAQKMPVPAPLREGSSHIPPVGVESERHVHDAYQINPHATGPATPNPHQFRLAAATGSRSARRIQGK